MNKFDKFATTSGNFEEIKYFRHATSYNVKRTTISTFSKIGSVDQPKPYICKNHKLHRFANTNSVFKEINYFRQASSYNVHVYQFLAKSS